MAGIFFSQTNSELSALRTGMILALPPAAGIPNGFFGKIANIIPVGNQLFISTTPASLSEAFVNASVSLDRPLTSDDLLQGSLQHKEFPLRKRS